MNDSAARMYDGYNKLQQWLGSDIRLQAHGRYVEDEELDELVQTNGYLNWNDYKAAQSFLEEDREAEKGQY